ncbi:MAG: chemotaxis protein CheW [Planctomycetota bacterium]
MQLLSFSVAGQPYAIESRRVIEVLPLVPARPLPQTPDYLLGIFTYRGRLMPLVDLARRLGVAPPAARLSTRVIVVEVEAGAEPGGRAVPLRLGLVAENVVAVRSADEAGATLPPLRLPGAEYLDRVLRIGGETVQVIDVRKLLPAELTAGLAAAAIEVRP